MVAQVCSIHKRRKRRAPSSYAFVFRTCAPDMAFFLAGQQCLLVWCSSEKVVYAQCGRLGLVHIFMQYNSSTHHLRCQSRATSSSPDREARIPASRGLSVLCMTRNCDRRRPSRRSTLTVIEKPGGRRARHPGREPRKRQRCPRKR